MGALLFALYATASSMTYFLGIFWAIIIPFMVATNDTMAYFCGRTFGKTRLIKLSPNKTLEGFLGGAFFTVVCVFLTIGMLFDHKDFVCMSHRIDMLPFEPI